MGVQVVARTPSAHSRIRELQRAYLNLESSPFHLHLSNIQIHRLSNLRTSPVPCRCRGATAPVGKAAYMCIYKPRTIAILRTYMLLHCIQA